MKRKKIKPRTTQTIRTYCLISKRWFVMFVSFVVIIFSCTNINNEPNIQDIANQWSAIERNLDTISIEYIDAFYETLNQFRQSELFRMYYSIPFSSQIKHSFTPLHIGLPIAESSKEIEKAIENIPDQTLVLRSAIISQDLDRVQAISKEMSSEIINLLKIDADVQRFIASSYFNLLITLAVFIVIIALLAFVLYRALARSLKREDENIKLTHTYMIAQEEERFRISRELHDTVIQDMRYLLLEAEKISSGNEKTSKIADIIRKTRTLCNDLIPPDFRFRELPDALKQLCLETSEKTGIDCRAEIDENIKSDFLTLEKKLQIFRIVQEALANIEKHAEAKEAIVTMRCDTLRGIVFIGISDDGKGFNSPLDSKGQIISNIEKSQQSHLGIISMKERAAILGGTLKIITAPGEGALVCVEIPVI